MQRLSRSDLEGALGFVRDLNESNAAEPFTTELLDRLTELVGCGYATYVGLDWPRRTVTAYAVCSNEDLSAMSTPYVPDDRWTTDDPRYLRAASFDKLSDRFDRRERERLRDELEYNAEFRVVDRIAFRSGDARRHSSWLSFDSSDRDFDERDRELVLVLRPHVEAIWRRATSGKQVSELLAVLECEDGAGTAPGHAIVLYGADGRIHHATREAQRLITEWFGLPRARLPHPLCDWVTIARPGDRHIERRNGSILTVEANGDFTLTLRERSAIPADLTMREREVLDLVAEGLTNAGIAELLWIAPSTVRKHLENVYAKLGVHSRTAAVARLAQSAE